MILLLVCATFFSGGCVLSLHPLYTEKDQVFDPALVGTWAEKDSEDTYTFQKADRDGYELTYVEKRRPAKFEAHLTRLGKLLFLDLYPKESEEKIENEMLEGHFIRVHSFSRVRIDGDVLRYAVMYGERLARVIAQKKVKIAHRVEAHGDVLILGAPTEDLQKFVLKHAQDTKAFGEEQTLYRRK